MLEKGGPLMQYMWCPYEKGKLEHRTKHNEPSYKNWILLLQPKVLPEARREAWIRSFPSSFRRSMVLPTS